MLRKYTPDPAQVVDWGKLVINEDGTSKRDLCVLWIAESRFCDPKL